MPYFDQTGPQGQGQPGKGLGGCRNTTPEENGRDTTPQGGMGRRTGRCSNQGRGRCGNGQDQRQGQQGQRQGQNRKGGQGRR